ncbi:MAG: flagellar basal body-associated FliL family protein [Pseudobdellovibrionaceae bacterium]
MVKIPDPIQSKDQPEGAEEELSPAQLESMILSEDPDFEMELAKVKSLPLDSSINLDVVDTGQDFSAENPWHHPIGLRKAVVLLLPFLPKLWEFQRHFYMTLQFSRARFSLLLHQAGPLLLQAIKSGTARTLEFAKGRITSFKNLTRGLKVVAVCLILAGILTLAFIYQSIVKGVFPEEKEYLMASLEEWAAQSYQLDAETEMDSFYDSPRSIQNIMSLPKMVVNLHPSPTSGPNPMAAVEFFLEGQSAEAVVEVKDREIEIRDLLQRTMEEMTYAEMESVEGKQQLTEKLRQALNTHLTKGKIRRVFFKEAVVKP